MKFFFLYSISTLAKLEGHKRSFFFFLIFLNYVKRKVQEKHSGIFIQYRFDNIVFFFYFVMIEKKKKNRKDSTPDTRIRMVE